MHFFSSHISLFLVFTVFQATIYFCLLFYTFNYANIDTFDKITIIAIYDIFLDTNNWPLHIFSNFHTTLIMYIH